MSVKDIIVFNILDSVLKFCGKSIVFTFFHMPGIDTDTEL
jgi:hypothetical protein